MNKILLESVLKRPHFILSLIFSLTILGVIGFFNIKQKLFPDVNRPQVSVVIVQQGASAKDIAENIAIPVEKALYTIDKVRKVSSVSKDEVCVITAEFEYEKDVNKAVSDVQNEITKIKSILPKNIKEPQIFKITDATAPVLTIAVYPKNDSISLVQVRQIVENQIKNKLLVLREVSNVDVFGGYKKEVLIKIDKNKLLKYNLSFTDVLTAIQKQNIDMPIGIITNNNSEFLIKSLNKKDRVLDLSNIFITPNIKLSDVAKIHYGYYQNKSLFYGNGKKAIAILVQRQETGDTLKTIHQVKKLISELKNEYRNLGFEITDTQENIIKTSNLNMLEALRDAVLMISVIIFFFLANIRQMIIAGISIPFVYGITIAIMWLLKMEFNIITLTGIILALGMLIDDAVVVLENIERHLHKLKKSVKDAVIDGTKEVLFPVFAGTVATTVVLIPLLFVGDFPEKMFRPLALTLIIAVIVSYFVSITFIPLIAPFLLKKTEEKNKLEKITDKISNALITPLKNFYVSIVLAVLKRKILAFGLFAIVIVLLVLSLRLIIPLIGKEIMPPMDTGIVKGTIVADSNLSVEEMENIVNKISEILNKDKRIKMYSIFVGSEAGVLTAGKADSLQTINLTIHYVDRFHRDEDIWSIENNLRKKIWQIPNLKYVHIFDYGATPLSTIRGNLDVMILGNDLKTLDNLATKIMERVYRVKGLTSVSKTWDYDKIVYNLKLDHQKLSQYKLTPYDLALQISSKIKGVNVSLFNIPNENSLAVKVLYENRYIDSIEDINDLYIKTKYGRIPLSYFAKIEKHIEPTTITRENLKYTIDVIGYRQKAAISHIMESYENNTQDIKAVLPAGYEISQQGDIKQLNNSLQRMLKAIAIGILLLFFALAPAFKSFLAPVAVIFAIPLSFIGASWSILFANYHQSMPGLMGIILLAGIITKNSILLIDFIQQAINKGKSLEDAIIDSIKLRTRPVLMTAFGTSVGMIPIAFGWALGLERLAPLGVVAIGGLIVGTFLTLIFVPLLYYFALKVLRK